MKAAGSPGKNTGSQKKISPFVGAALNNQVLKNVRPGLLSIISIFYYFLLSRIARVEFRERDHSKRLLPGSYILQNYFYCRYDTSHKTALKKNECLSITEFLIVE